MTTDNEQPQPCPVPVSIVENKAEKVEAATFGAWTGYVLAGTEPAFQILPQDRKRRRAVIVISGAAPGLIYIAESQGKAQAKKGGPIGGGNSVTLESQTQMWISPDGTNPMTIAVLLEGYRAGE